MEKKFNKLAIKALLFKAQKILFKQLIILNKNQVDKVTSRIHQLNH